MPRVRLDAWRGRGRQATFMVNHVSFLSLPHQNDLAISEEPPMKTPGTRWPVSMPNSAVR